MYVRMHTPMSAVFAPLLFVLRCALADGCLQFVGNNKLSSLRT